MLLLKIRSWLNWKKRMKIVSNKVITLKIEKAGLLNDNIPFIKLRNGPIFYGPSSSETQKKYYYKLPSQTKKNIPEDCFGIAMDIILRYQEGGLMSGGPNKEEYYKVKSSDIVAEMGAYMGFFCIHLSEKVGKKGKVLAIEPIDENISYLSKNIQENKFDNVVIIKKGVWKKHGFIEFHNRDGDKQSASISLKFNKKPATRIEVDSLDNILLENNIKKVNFMIIQLNGAELEALQGLVHIKPENLAIAARYKKNGEPLAPIIVRLLKSRGYYIKIVKKEFVYASLRKMN